MTPSSNLSPASSRDPSEAPAAASRVAMPQKTPVPLVLAALLAALALARAKSSKRRDETDKPKRETNSNAAREGVSSPKPLVERSVSGRRATSSPLKPREEVRDELAGGLAPIELSARGARATVSPFGATVLTLEFAQDGDDGARDDLVLGFEDVESYDETEGRPYFGAMCGRVANRIANGEFKVGSKTYSCAKNNGENTLHGGAVGWDRKRWTVVDKSRSSVTLCYESVDGEEGFPGNVKAYVVYSLVGFGERLKLECDEKEGKVRLKVENFAEFTTKMTATTDSKTPISTVQHTYFNLNGHSHGKNCDSHIIEMPNCHAYIPVDEETLIPTGEGLRKVDGSKFDLRQATRMFEKSSEGYDNSFVIEGPDATRPASELPRAPPRLAARVSSEETGRVLEVFTDAPGVHLYTGNFLSATMLGKTKKHARYIKQSGFCLETGWFPDAVNQHEKVGSTYPSIIVGRGDTYSHTLTYRISKSVAR